MSKSIHTTYSDFKGLTKKEIYDQKNDPDSDLHKLTKKRALKRAERKKRKK